MTPVAAVVVAYEQPDPLAACLASLARAGVDLRIVVDNSERQPRRVEEVARDAGATYVRSPGNVGFGAAVNRGVEVAADAGASHVFVVNPDAVVTAAPRAFPSGSAVFVPRLAGRDEVLLGVYDRALGMVRRSGAPTGRRRFTFVSGAAFVAPVDVLRRHPFAPGFHLYHEDVELSARLAASQVAVRLDPSFEVEHAVGSLGSTGFSRDYCFYNSRNRLWFARSDLLPWGAVAIAATPLDVARVLRTSYRRGGVRALVGNLAPLAAGIVAGLFRRVPSSARPEQEPSRDRRRREADPPARQQREHDVLGGHRERE